MSYKSIIAVASGGPDDAQLLNAAVQIASRCSAQVRVLPAFPDPAADLVYFGTVLSRASDGVIERVRAGEQEMQLRLEQLAVDAAARAGVRYEACGVGPCVSVDKRPLMPSMALADAAVLADLVVFGAPAVRDAFALGAPFAETLLETRAPVLLVKDDQFGFGAVAVAWDGSAQAGRAVRASMNFLRLAEEVVILQNLDDVAAEVRTPASAEALVAHLTRHGVARTRIVTVEGEDISKSLIRGAHDQHCGALVAGAYGRPRLYELALGGTTRALVNAEDRLHLLLAH